MFGADDRFRGAAQSLGVAIQRMLNAPLEQPAWFAAHPFEPIVENRKAREVGRTIKVVSFNAQGGGNLEGVVRCLQQKPLAGADIVLLCEADWRNERSAYRDFAAEVAKALQMSFAFVPQFGQREENGTARPLTGNAVLCSQPLDDIRAIPIPNRFLHRRLYRKIGVPAGMVARARFNGRLINLGAIHLNSRWDPHGRAAQMKEYLNQLPDGPTIIGGDLNTTTLGLQNRKAVIRATLKLAMQPARLSQPQRWEGLFQHLERAGFAIDGANDPRKRTFTPSRFLPYFLRPNLDWIAVRGLKPVPRSARAVAAQPSLLSARVSDHDFVMCEIRL